MLSFAAVVYYTTTTTQSSGGGLFGLIVAAVVWLISIVAFWKVFTKAGQPGWASIIPIYNLYIILKISGKPGWWLLLYLIPVVNFVVHILVCLDLAKAFGKSSTFGIFGLWIFSFIGFLILGYGDAKYVGAHQQ